MDQLKFYMSPEIYKAEKGIDDEFSHVNSIFEEQSKVGRAKGKLISPKFIREAIAEFEDFKKKENKTTFIQRSTDTGLNEEELG